MENSFDASVGISALTEFSRLMEFNDPAQPNDPGQGTETGTATSVLERTEEKPSDGDRDRFSHFVRRDRFAQMKAAGQAVVALCGKVWVPRLDGNKYPICPKCKAIMEELNNLSENWPFTDGGAK